MTDPLQRIVRELKRGKARSRDATRQGSLPRVILFVGRSVTEKTMAARAIAEELGVHLLRIDLSTVVSQYIGETEENLDRVFQNAGNAGAILMFDEADALFGRRSQVRDPHDRYVNVEVSYLLRRMEAYSGIVILATDRKGNIDSAFLRRVRYVVDFPRPV